MTHIRIKGFQIFKDRHGNLRCYHRASKIAVDLKKFPVGSAEFMGECARIAALCVRQSAKPGTLGLLVREYKKSPAWRDLQPRSQHWYGDIFKYLEPINDTLLIRFDRPLVIRIRDKAQEKHSWYFANKLKTTLSTLFSWGVERGHISMNPAKEIRKVSRPKDTPTINRPWSDKERFVVLEAASWKLKVPIALMMYTGMDPCDCIRIMKNQYDGHAISYKRAKTGNAVWKPVPMALKVILDGAPKHNATTLAASSQGSPWGINGLSSAWQELKGNLEGGGRVSPGLTMKGLRHTKATLLRELGFDDRTIADTLGQNTEAMARHYSRHADVRQKMEKVINVFDHAEKIKYDNFVKPTKKTVKPKK